MQRQVGVFIVGLSCSLWTTEEMNSQQRTNQGTRFLAAYASTFPLNLWSPLRCHLPEVWWKPAIPLRPWLSHWRCRSHWFSSMISARSSLCHCGGFGWNMIFSDLWPYCCPLGTQNQEQCTSWFLSRKLRFPEMQFLDSVSNKVLLKYYSFARDIHLSQMLFSNLLTP